MKTAYQQPRFCRTMERMLLARDRMELAAADRLLTALKIQAPRKKAKGHGRSAAARTRA